MPIRLFHGTDGVLWQVWNVVPGRHEGPERRQGYDRRGPDPVLRYSGPERRATVDRRHPLSLVSPRLAWGWLAFESPTEKRRLAPIPQYWERLSEEGLARLCAAARPVAPPVPPPH